MCYKYLVFLNTECDRLLTGESDLDDKMTHLKIELDRFKERVTKSNLPKDLKVKIMALKLDYAYDKHRETKNLLGFAFLGRLAQIKRDQKLCSAVESLKHEIKGLPMFIQLNY